MNQAVEKALQTVAAMAESGRQALSGSSETPELDARVLLQTLLGRDHAWLVAHRNEPVHPDVARKFHDWIGRRAKSEPVAYIIGRKDFWTLDLKITKDVLVPRPETELLVRRSLEKVPLSESVSIADLGTGSGAVGLSIASERPLCKVVATDSCRAALAVAEQNKARHGLRNISFRQGNWYEPLNREQYSAIACNPPYVPHSHYEAALSYEPSGALFSGKSGIDALEVVVLGAPDHLEPGGWLLVEHGFDQKSAVQSLFKSAGFESISTWDDLAGHPRITEGQWSRRLR